jgi:hypothetical protein
MRLLVTLLVVLATGFLAVMGYYYWRDGSMQAAGAKVDEGLAKIDRTTEPMQESLKDLGDGAKETVDNATDGDDRT